MFQISIPKFPGTVAGQFAQMLVGINLSWSIRIVGASSSGIGFKFERYGISMPLERSPMPFEMALTVQTPQDKYNPTRTCANLPRPSDLPYILNQIETRTLAHLIKSRAQIRTRYSKSTLPRLKTRLVAKPRHAVRSSPRPRHLPLVDACLATVPHQELKTYLDQSLGPCLDQKFSLNLSVGPWPILNRQHLIHTYTHLGPHPSLDSVSDSKADLDKEIDPNCNQTTICVLSQTWTQCATET